jgi:enhancing lycopene biosynthesis protein 2
LDLRASDFDGLVIPGGFGVAKNLCTFAAQGSVGRVNSEMARVLTEFRKAGKPMGAVCIAPALVAMAFPQGGFELTLGPKGEASAELEKLGHRHVEKKVSEWHHDTQHKMLSTPAYMYEDASLKDIFLGVHGLVRDLCNY